jgi:DNA-binding CsgD family transcriptional regulator
MLLADGADDAQIAGRLAISADAFRTHLGSVFFKMQVKSRTEAAVRVIKEGWLPD